MSNIIPPLLSSTPPPMVGALDEEEDDEFGDFAVATNMSYGCDALSLPSSLQKSPKKSVNQSSPKHYDSNGSEITDISVFKGVEKDFQDKRKNSVTNSEIIASASESSTGQEIHTELNVNNLLYNNGKIKPKTDNKYKNAFQYFPEIPPDIVPDEEDEFEDVDNGYVEEFDEFQDFESAVTVNNGSVLDKKFTIAEEKDIPDVNGTVTTNSESSQEGTVPVLKNECKVSEKIESNSLKQDDISKLNEENNLGDAKSQITDSVNGKIVDTVTKCKNSEDNSTILPNHELQEPVSDETCITNLPIQFNATNENKTSNSDINDSCKNATISQAEDIQIENEIPTVEESVIINKVNIDAPSSNKASSESEDEFGDFENHSFKSNVPDAVEPSQSVDQDEIPNLPVVKTANEDLGGQPNISDDDFGDFESSAEPNLQWDSDPFNNTKSTDPDTNNFGDFDNQVFEEPLPPQPDEDQDFGDFSEAHVSKPDTLESDEFGDFNDCSNQAETSQSSSREVADGQRHRSLSIDVETIPQQAQTIILEMFPVIKQATEDYCEEDFTSNDAIFKGLADVTDTCALLYQWSKSNSQNCFLRALNIDTRNILYGPRWNESMPRYAATLGYTPLEPVKSEVLTPTSSEPSTATVVTSSQTPSSDTVPSQTEIPSAQFDWVGSGLTNPLENSPASTMLLDLEQLVASLDIQFSSTLTPKSPNSPSPVNDIDDWEFWLRLTPKKVIEKQRDPISKESKNYQEQNVILQASIPRKTSQETDIKLGDFEFSSVLQPEVSTVLQTHSDSGSVKSLQLEIQPEEIISKSERNSPDFNDFTSFQSSSKTTEENSNFSSWSFNAIPLRETHISNLQSEPSFIKPNFDEPGWLKPTIVTPDLPRKINVPEEPPGEETEEFAEFQTSQPIAKTETAPPIKLEVEKIEPEITPEPTVNTNSLSNNEDDDEFTDFQSTLPNSLNSSVLQTPVTHEPLQPAILEPLKPSLLQPMTPAVINWPDPGITDDDLIRIELNYKPKSLNSESEQSVEVDTKQKSVNSSANTQVREEVSKPVEEDDWSDFVSNQESAPSATGHTIQPVFKTSQLKQPNRTSTPELSLCIPQLNHIQPPRRPVPVITQQGLLQTKLPVEALVQPSVQQSKTYPQVNQLQNGFQPSLISNQFAAQFGQGLGYQNIQQNRLPPTMDIPKQNKGGLNNLQQDLYNSSKSSQYFLASHTSKPLAPSSISASKADEFDEEWTDFVSSQPAPPSLHSMAPSGISNGLLGHPQPKINFDWNRPPQFTSWSANVAPNIITNPVSFDSFQSYSSPTQADLLKNKTTNRKNPNMAMQPKKNTIPSISSVPDLEFIAPKSRTWKK